MLLAVDIGNTNIVLGFVDGDRITGSYRISTKGSHTSDEYGVMISQFLTMQGLESDDLDDAIIASVVPKVMHSFRSSLLKFFQIDPIIIGPGVKSGMAIRLDDPKSLGADCLADCAGAYYLYGGPVLVADFGTATTFNYVDAQGAIVSGLISIGLGTAATALSRGTAQLPEVELTQPTSILATATDTAMQAGLYYGCLGGVERTIQQFHDELDEDFKVVATGGMGRIFQDDSDFIDIYDPDLVFKGMALIYRHTIG
ncbi:pantothenate kinase [Bifidobacterium aemilianum]|uniref:Type III pantothenate kinase n=1 Tax=Bifidobacterium aemilianum TaxID=2493120 RepID=A0A366K953_9BIFI|nr:type III pantothenate kinase [Bifidobacterium aemilianum]RBP98246.1 pantothenate kinase [Bifidobacterium aemilianum]